MSGARASGANRQGEHSRGISYGATDQAMAEPRDLQPGLAIATRTSKPPPNNPPSSRTCTPHENYRSPKAPITLLQKAILAGALFMKGGLLGSFIPFTTLWTHLHGYSPTQVGLLAGADILFSILLVPVYGSILDTWKCHNYGLIVTMVATGVLKGLYVPFADSFFMLLLLTALTAPCLKGCNSVLDAQCLYALPDKAEFGQVRLFGNAGFGFLAFATGLYVAAGTTAEKPYHRVDQIFVAFAFICFTAAVYWSVLHRYVENIAPDAEMLLRDRSPYAELRLVVKKVWVTKNCARYVCGVFVLGMQLGIIGAYEFIMLAELNAGVDFMGACRLFGMLWECPVWLFGMRFIDKIGLKTAQVLFLAVNAARLYWYGNLGSASEALWAEILAGFSFAFPYMSICVYLGRAFDEDTKASMQTMVMTVFTGLGTGVGTVAGGLLIDNLYGGRIQHLFRGFAGFTFCFALLFALFDFLKAGERSSSDVVSEGEKGETAAADVGHGDADVGAEKRAPGNDDDQSYVDDDQDLISTLRDFFSEKGRSAGSKGAQGALEKSAPAAEGESEADSTRIDDTHSSKTPETVSRTAVV